jgi:hypothetical protein
MKRTAIVIGIAAAIFVAPNVANAGHVAQVNPQAVKQVVTTQRVSKMVTAQRVSAAITAQRVQTQRQRAHRLSVQRIVAR